MIRITGQSRGTRLGSRLESASRMRRWCSRKRTSSAPQPLTHSPIPSQQCTYRLRRLFAVCLHFVTPVYLTHGASPSIMAVPSASGRVCSTEIAHECTDGKNVNQCLREHGWAHKGRAGTVCLIARPGRLAPPPELGEVYPGGQPDIGARYGKFILLFLEWILLIVSYVPFKHGLDCNELDYNIFAPALGVNGVECQACWRVAAHGARRAYIAILRDLLPTPPLKGPPPVAARPPDQLSGPARPGERHRCVGPAPAPPSTTCRGCR